MTRIALIDRNWYNVTASFFFAKKRSLCLKHNVSFDQTIYYSIYFPFLNYKNDWLANSIDFSGLILDNPSNFFESFPKFFQSTRDQEIISLIPFRIILHASTLFHAKPRFRV